MAGPDYVRRAIETTYAALTASDAAADNYLLAHGWTTPSPGYWSKGGTVHVLPDTALQTELLA
jgi:hypothetical protein